MDGETDAFSVEYRLKNKHDSYTWILCRGITLHNDDGNPIRIAGSHTDISGQKQTLAVMEHMQRETQAKAEALEHSNRELDGLALPPGLHIIDVALNMPCLITAPLPLSQVFGNLLSNAIKYHDHPEDGHIAVSARSLEGGGYEFSVADDGPGIAPEFHNKVFQIFQTLNARDKVESTGVGLTVAKRIIEQLGGNVMLESAEGEGSIFRFTLPKGSNEEHITNDKKRR